MPGFHQGDADFFCYMYKRQDDGRYSEHARLKGEKETIGHDGEKKQTKRFSLGNCAFILPDLKPERYHEFRVFTKNKYGDNYDKSIVIAVGERQGKMTRLIRIHFFFFFLDLI